MIFDRVVLPPPARKQYDDMLEKLTARIGEGAVLAASTAVATGKLAQMANGFVYDNDGVTEQIHDEKRQWLTELIDDAVGPMILIYEYRQDLKMLRDLLGEDLPYLGDGVTDAVSDHTISQWNDKLPFLAMHPASGGPLRPGRERTRGGPRPAQLRAPRGGTARHPARPGRA